MSCVSESAHPTLLTYFEHLREMLLQLRMKPFAPCVALKVRPQRASNLLAVRLDRVDVKISDMRCSAMLTNEVANLKHARMFV
jgi:hypothetical protein